MDSIPEEEAIGNLGPTSKRAVGLVAQIMTFPRLSRSDGILFILIFVMMMVKNKNRGKVKFEQSRNRAVSQQQLQG